jgi:hypothetical protein
MRMLMETIVSASSKVAPIFPEAAQNRELKLGIA